LRSATDLASITAVGCGADSAFVPANLPDSDSGVRLVSAFVEQPATAHDPEKSCPNLREVATGTGKLPPMFYAAADMNKADDNLTQSRAAFNHVWQRGNDRKKASASMKL
jgi:hypothetical protein